VKVIKVKVIKSKCPQNHPCPSVRVCPVDAIKQVGFDAPNIIEDKCTKCGKCIKYCPMEAIQFVEE
jgi:Fe-S-cluster-containing hydrogenase component 2